MIWIGGVTREENIRRREEWHKWFAWRPVTVEIILGKKVRAWLETVERKGKHKVVMGSNEWKWEYREKEERMEDK